jgi:hypothetical protein
MQSCVVFSGDFSEESKRNFVAISECKIAVSEVSYGEITRRGKTEAVVVIDLPQTDRAAELWTQRKYLVSAARQLNLSRYVLFQVRGNRFGLAMIALEQPSRL